MLYTLPDGKKLDFARVESISKIRDYGQTENIVEKQHIGFAIHLKNKETIEVKETYHYSDWAEAKLRLNKIRNDILSEWEKYKTEK